jgi:hypothetical protein
MKAVALGVMFVGYVALVSGVNHIMGGCMPLKSIVWPSTSAVSDPCSSTTAASSSTVSTIKQPSTVGQ